MPEPDPPQFTRETILRLAREQAGLALNDAGADSLVDLVNGLQAFAREVVARPREGVEPASTFVLEDWSND